MRKLRPGLWRWTARHPDDVEAITTSDEEALLWVPAHAALVAEDVFLGRGGGGVRVCPDSWLPKGVTPEGLRAELRPLLDRPIELVLLAPS